jgi:hypothetical protein
MTTRKRIRRGGGGGDLQEGLQAYLGPYVRSGGGGRGKRGGGAANMVGPNMPYYAAGGGGAHGGGAKINIVWLSPNVANVYLNGKRIDTWKYKHTPSSREKAESAIRYDVMNRVVSFHSGGGGANMVGPNMPYYATSGVGRPGGGGGGAKANAEATNVLAVLRDDMPKSLDQLWRELRWASGQSLASVERGLKSLLRSRKAVEFTPGMFISR